MGCGDFRRLITPYKNVGGDCPLVMSKNDAPSCGTSSQGLGVGYVQLYKRIKVWMA